MEGDESFLALVHHDGKIRYKTREGVKFTDKSPTNVFITPRTTLLDLQLSIIRKLGLDGRKRNREPRHLEGPIGLTTRLTATADHRE
ncbi:hypothetical protein PIB30_006059 [Stylosanthes scabra]|uniref:Uncharacterized protein n=1 Tax=Stylosanthes scabra TaxID=79078 RepID=A0ABU6V781_9FABA|nr:hypothetical protein [Stylosanthes scabra]